MTLCLTSDGIVLSDIEQYFHSLSKNVHVISIILLFHASDFFKAVVDLISNSLNRYSAIYQLQCYHNPALLLN